MTEIYVLIDKHNDVVAPWTGKAELKKCLQNFSSPQVWLDAELIRYRDGEPDSGTVFTVAELFPEIAL